MKRSFLYLLFLLSFSLNIFAQDEKLDELPFTDEQLKEEKAVYFVLGGGVTGSFLLNNFDDINKMLKTSNYPELSSPLFAFGGQGITGLPWIPNMRVGISGMGANQSVSNSKGDSTVNYQFSSLGLSLGYGIILTKGLVVVPEVTISSGGVIIERYYSNGSINFDSLANSKSTINVMSNNFINLQSQLNIEWAATNFLMMRAAVGYNYQLSSDWKYNYQTTISNVPNGFSTNNLYAQFGVFLGLFSY